MDSGTDYAEEEKAAAESELSVPLQVPERNSMAVKMVPRSLVYQLLEYRSDGSRMSSIFWAVVGGILGIGVNWVTVEPFAPTGASVAVMACFIVFGSVFAFLWSCEEKRAKGVADELDNFEYKAWRSDYEES